MGDLIASGNQTRVYKAINRINPKLKVAIKVVPKELFSQSEIRDLKNGIRVMI